MGEDCLYLNIWAPKARATAPGSPVPLMPVMLWIFGGGYYTGSGDSLQTRGNQLVKAHGDVIVITHNYRLGVLGWLASEAMQDFTLQQTGRNTTGNMGFLDQVMALKWIQRNIRAFGGDPENVLLFGESAGAGAVAAHLTSQHSQGLFHKAILQSGGFNEWNAMTLRHASHNFDALLRTIARFRRQRPAHWVHAFGCHRGMSDVDCLLHGRIPAKKLVALASGNIYNHMTNASDWDGMEQCQWGPVVDGNVLLRHPFKHLLNRINISVPVIIGMNKDDGTEFLDGCKNGETWGGKATCNMGIKLYNHLYNYFANAQKIDNPHCFQDPIYHKWIAVNWGRENVEALAEIYRSSSISPPPGHTRTNFWAAETLVGDYIMACSQIKAADLLSTQAPVYQYYFTRTPTEEPFGKPPPRKHITDGFGACHGCEIPFVFVRLDSKQYGVKGAGEVELALTMSTYWTNFAWSGDPNSPASRWSQRATAGVSVAWPKVTPGVDSSIVFDATRERATVHALNSHPRSSACEAFWEPYFHRTGWFDGATPLQSPAWLRMPHWSQDVEAKHPPWQVCTYSSTQSEVANEPLGFVV